MPGIRDQLSALLGKEVSKNWYDVQVRQMFLVLQRVLCWVAHSVPHR